jgi:CheY-like chemotaxis protein
MDMAAKRIAGVVSDLKNFSRQSSIVDKTKIDINTAVKNAIRLIQTTLNRTGIDIHLNLAEDIPAIEGNRQGIEQAVFNVVLNAIQAITHDHGKIIITTRFKRTTGNIDIVISDNGEGISSAIMNKIFDPFVTDKQGEGRTGLGLSVAYSLVKAHNGNISFTTDIHKGTTFTISIPIINRQRKFKVLIADDDSAIREILAEVLTVERGYQVSQASNGTEVNIKLGTYHPDILILDLFMPKMDGLEVCRAIKNEPELAALKVMITTGFPSDPKLEEICKLGFTKICSKPFNIPYFLEQIDAMLISS